MCVCHRGDNYIGACSLGYTMGLINLSEVSTKTYNTDGYYIHKTETRDIEKGTRQEIHMLLSQKSPK